MLTIVRGLPGSGKTTWAKEHIQILENNTDDYIVLVEADQFWTYDGKYNFDKTKTKYAHQWCQAMVSYYLQRGYSVVVANTFTTIFELFPYVALANDYGVKYQVIECVGNYGSVHNVPDKVLEIMKKRWEPFPYTIDSVKVTTI